MLLYIDGTAQFGWGPEGVVVTESSGGSPLIPGPLTIPPNVAMRFEGFRTEKKGRCHFLDMYLKKN